MMVVGHPPPPDNIMSVLETSNHVFPAVFTLEIMLKIFVLWRKEFLADLWNLFDLFVVVVSLVELVLPAGAGALSTLRRFRLLRVFKLARNILSLRILIEVLGRVVFALGHICGISLLFVYIFMLMGMTFFSNKMGEQAKVTEAQAGAADNKHLAAM